MSARYLPSAQFSLFVVSLAIAGGLVVAASYSTKPNTANLASITPSQNPTYDWRAALGAVQTESGIEAPGPIDAATIDSLRDAAKNTSSLTDAVSRTLLINLSNAKAQGLGSDIPTQNQLVASAVGQIDATQQARLYTRADLTVVADTSDAQKAYGNALAIVMSKSGGLGYAETLIAIDMATAKNSQAELEQLPSIATEYSELSKALLRIPVPQTLSPFHLQLVNNFQKIAGAYTPMATILTDPLRGLSAVKDYQALTQETLLVFINIGQTLHKNGILFTKDEPGSAWDVLVSAQ